jgi:hypothetical protein
MAVKKSTPAPFAIPFRQALRNDGIGHDKGYALIKSGDWQSYLDGGTRMVTVASINARRERMLAESAGKFKPAPLRGQVRRPHEQQSTV